MAVTEPPWHNKASGTIARNGTSSHTISFGFTSTTGRLLVVVIYGAVTHAASGWTEQLQPVSSGELSLFTKTSAGETSITVTHNASNYPSYWVAYEFPAGSTYTAGSSSSPTSDTFPALSSLPGTAQVIIAARGRVNPNSNATAASTSWGSPWVEDADIFEAYTSGGDSGYVTVAHQINFTGTSITPSATTTYSTEPGSWPLTDRQHLVAALDVVEITSTVNGAASVSSTSGLTAAATSVRTAPAAPASTSTLTAAALTARPGVATAGSTSSLTAAATVIRLGATTATSTSTLTAAATSIRLGTVVATSIGTLTAAAVVIVPATATLASPSTLTASTAGTVSGTAAPASASTLTATALTARPGAAAVASASTLTAAGVHVAPAGAPLVGGSALTAAAAVVVQPAATLASVSALSAVIGSFNQPGRQMATTAAARHEPVTAAARLPVTETTAALTALSWP